MTGRSVASHQTTDMPDQTDPRALVATSDPPISRGAELSKEIVAELVRHALQVIRSTGEHLSIDDRIVLNGALAVMRQTADEIDNLLKADSSTSKRVTTRKK